MSFVIQAEIAIAWSFVEQPINVKLNNEQGFEADFIEAALAHVGDNQVYSAYNRTNYLERRKPMMCWWSGHIERLHHSIVHATRNRLKIIAI